MELTEGSETSANHKLTPGKYPKEHIQYSKHGESLKSRAQLNCLKNNFKMYAKIDIKTAPTCFGAVMSSSGRALFLLVKVTVVKIAN
jgi:hypothetical protein